MSRGSGPSQAKPGGSAREALLPHEPGPGRNEHGTGSHPEAVTPFRQHERPVLLFDMPCIGFARWAKRRLEALGYGIVIPPYTLDEHIVVWARRTFRNRPVIVVTTDADFPFEPKIVLPTYFKTNRGYGKPKYERLYTLLCRALCAVGQRL